MNGKIEVGDELLLVSDRWRDSSRTPVRVTSVGRKYLTVDGHGGQFFIDTKIEKTKYGAADYLLTEAEARRADERTELEGRLRTLGLYDLVGYKVKYLTNRELREIVSIVESSHARSLESE